MTASLGLRGLNAGEHGVIAILGAGNMGSAMALRLSDFDVRIKVWDTSVPQREVLIGFGLQVLEPMHWTSAGVGICIVCVVNAEQVWEALFGASGACQFLLPGALFVLCSTIEPDDVQAIAVELQSRGFGVMDAPMSGGPARARDGTMSLMLACAHDLRDRHDSWLSCISSQIFFISERIGDASRTKLVNNLLAGVNLAGASEALALAETLGLNLATTLAVIERSSGQSWISTDRMRRALAHDVGVRAHMTLLAKDTALATSMAVKQGFDPILGAQARDIFAAAVVDGYALSDDSALLAHQRLRKLAGLR